MTNNEQRDSVSAAIPDSAPRSDTPRRRLIGGSVGTFVEWYDYLVFGLSVPVLSRLFFPDSNPTAAVLGTLALFGASFFMGPIGGLLFGYIGDRFGRIRALSATILLMGLSTVAIGLLPTYATIGIFAPILLGVARLLQGLSAGGEHGGSLTYVLESAPSNRRGLWVSIVYGASNAPLAFMGLIILGLQLSLGSAAYEEWAWRLPFLAGGVLAAVGLWIRLRLGESETFLEAVEEAEPETPIRAVLTTDRRAFLTVFFLCAPQVIAAFLLITYMYSYLVETVGMDEVPALLSNSITALAVTVLVPVTGVLADRFGRRPLLLAGLIWIAVTSYPALQLANTGAFWGALVGQLLLGLGIALFIPAVLVTMLELFRTSNRYTGFATSQSLGTAIFGGTTPLVAAALVAGFGPMAPAIYVIAAAVFGFYVLRRTPETRDRDLSETVQPVTV